MTKGCPLGSHKLLVCTALVGLTYEAVRYVYREVKSSSTTSKSDLACGVASITSLRYFFYNLGAPSTRYGLGAAVGIVTFAKLVDYDVIKSTDLQKAADMCKQVAYAILRLDSKS